MKTIVSIAFASLLFVEALIPSMETLELAKLPALITHYQQHKVENPGLSLIGFLQLHYENSKHHDQDIQTHHDLPFGNHHQHNCNLFHLFLTIPEVSIASASEIVVVKNPVEYQAPAELSFYGSIWQPPRVS